MPPQGSLTLVVNPTTSSLGVASRRCISRQRNMLDAALDVGNVFGGLTIASAREVAADAPLLRDADGYAAAVLSPYETVAKTLSIGGKGSRLPAGLGA